MAAKDVMLRAFRVDASPTLVQSSNSLLQALKDRLNGSIAEDRQMLLNQEDSTKEADLLSGFEIYEQYIFGTIMRIAPGADDAHVDSTLMQKHSFSVSELQRTATMDHAVYKSHFYICMNDKYLVTTLKRPTTITRVETYINWLIKSHVFSFTPVVVPPPNLKLEDIKSITVRSASQNVPDSEREDLTDNKIYALNKYIWNTIKGLIFNDMAELPDIDFEKVVSAELLLRIKKNNSCDADINKILGAALKPVADIDQITFKDKKGRPIKGSEIEKTEPVSVETTDQGYLSEPALSQVMARFIDKLMQ